MKPWQEILLSTVVSENVEIQHRSCYVLRNMLSVDKEMAEKVIEGQMLEVLMALSILEDPQKEVVKKCAASCLEICVKYELIKPKEWAPRSSINFLKIHCSAKIFKHQSVCNRKWRNKVPSQQNHCDCTVDWMIPALLQVHVLLIEWDDLRSTSFHFLWDKVDCHYLS